MSVIYGDLWWFFQISQKPPSPHLSHVYHRDCLPKLATIKLSDDYGYMETAGERRMEGWKSLGGSRHCNRVCLVTCLCRGMGIWVAILRSKSGPIGEIKLPIDLSWSGESIDTLGEL